MGLHGIDNFLGYTLAPTDADSIHSSEIRLTTSHGKLDTGIYFYTESIQPKSPILLCSAAPHGCSEDINSSRERESYRITPVPDKGLRMVATRSICRGERILWETPLIRQSRFDDDNVAMSQYCKLTDSRKQQVLLLHNIRPAWGPVEGVI